MTKELEEALERLKKYKHYADLYPYHCTNVGLYAKDIDVLIKYIEHGK